MSTVTAFTPIPERSDATPGLFNSRFQQLQDNIVSSVSDLTGWNRGSVTTQIVSAFSIVAASIDSGGEHLNVVALGAKGDGVTDSSVFFQRAFDSNITVIYAPAGHYIWNSQCSIPSNKVFCGEGQHTWISARSTLPKTLLRNTNWPSGNSNIAIRNLRFDGAASSVTSSGMWDLPIIDMLSCRSVFVDNIFLEHSLGWSLSFYSSTEVFVSNVHVNSDGDGAPGGVDGLHFIDCTHVTVDNADIVAGDDCIGITSQFRDVNDIVIRNVVAQSVSANGVIFNEESTTTHSINSIFVSNIAYDGTGNAVRYNSINSSGNTSLSRRAFISNIYGNDMTDSVVRVRNVNDVHISNVFSPRCLTHAVDVQLSQGVSIFNIHSQNAGGTGNDNGVNLSACTQVALGNVMVQKAATWGVQIFGCSRVHAHGIMAVDCGTFGTGQERGGIRLHNCADTVLSGCYSTDAGSGNHATGLRITGTASRVFVGPDCLFSGLSAGVLDSAGVELAVMPSLHALSEQSLGFYRSAASTLLLSYGTLGVSHLSLDASSIMQVGGRRFLQGGSSGDASNYLYSGGAGGLRLMNQADAVVVVKMDDAGALQGPVANSAIYPAFTFQSETSLGLYRSGASTLALSYGAFAHPTGSATSPSINFSSESSLGFYRSAVSTIGLSYGAFAVPTGSAVTPSLNFSSESSLGFYRSGVSTIGLSYGAFALPAGSAVAPSLNFSSESSLGFYRPGAGTMALTSGFSFTLNQSRLLSIRTLAASLITASAANAVMRVDEVLFTVGGASGASLAIHSGGTVYVFNSALSAKAT